MILDKKKHDALLLWMRSKKTKPTKVLIELKEIINNFLKTWIKAENSPKPRGKKQKAESCGLKNKHFMTKVFFFVCILDEESQSLII